MSVAELAEELQHSQETVRQLLNRGMFRGAYKAGRGGQTSPWRIPMTALDHYRKRQPQGYRAA
ncbi:helix-turn-helix domain-containing protein [Arthrobacter ginkgonis]